MMQANTFHIETADGLQLHGVDWAPQSDARSVVCLLHGLGEYCDRYDHVAEALGQHGHAVVSIDLRGHGRSEGKRGHTPDYASLMNDIFLLLQKGKHLYPDCPIFLYGHSLGGNLAIHYALRKQPHLAGIVATAPLLRLAYTPPKAKTWVLQALNALHLNPTLPSGLDDNALSRDLNVVRTYRNDPLTHRRISPTLAVEMIRNGAWNLAHAAELPCPILLVHGAADRITSVAATKEFAAHTRADCTLKIWDDLYHEPHNEPEKGDVLDFIGGWLDAHS